MAVPEQTPYIEHTGNGVTTSFALEFLCESKDHLIVLVDEIEPPIATWSLTGGNVVFTTAPAAGKKITLQRNTPFSRTTDYQSYNNSFRPPAVNKDFDWIWLKLQELGVADWILGSRIDALKNYVDRKDDELKAYLMEEIRKQGVALDQLDEYYNYLMERLAQIAVDKGWDAAFVVDASGKNQQQINYLSLARFDSLVSITDYGASPEKTAEENDAALFAAITDLNAKYTGMDGFLRISPPKCALMIPSNGEYKFSGNFHITGNYSLFMYGVCRHEGTVANTPFIKIGRQVEYDSLADNEYVLNAYTTKANTYGFELLNMVCSHIQTRKIKGFNEALRCVARQGRGFFGNTFRLGTFDSNIIDLHIRAETNGAPNANRFYDGFFYKQRNMSIEQNCVKISSDGTYDDIDSNLFDGLNFEEGKATVEGTVDCIPINLEVGVQNRFINIRTENNSNTALARVNKRGNTIEVRAAFTTSTEIISSTVQQTLVVPQDKMQKVFGSGDLAKESIKLSTSGRIWNPIITFNDANVLNSNSTLSSAIASTFDLTNAGIKFLGSRAMLSFKMKTNGDRRFLLRTHVENPQKRLNIAIACYDANGNRLVNDAALATGTWGVASRIKSNDNFPLSYTANSPWGNAGAYQTPTSEIQQRLPFEVHSSVAMIEVYYMWGSATTDNDVTVSRFELYSLEGNASPVDAASPSPTSGDRKLYTPGRGYLTFNLSRSIPFDPPSLGVGEKNVQNFVFVGVELGDILTSSFNANLQGVSLEAWVTSTDNISVRFTNNTNAVVDLPNGVLNFLSRRIIN